MGLYKLDGHKTVAVSDLLTWGQLFGTVDRRVLQTFVGGAKVSTIFLGIDHNLVRFVGGSAAPVLFETMVFGGPLDGDQWRYETWDQAVEGHWRAYWLVRRARSPKRRRMGCRAYRRDVRNGLAA